MTLTRLEKLVNVLAGNGDAETLTRLQDPSSSESLALRQVQDLARATYGKMPAGVFDPSTIPQRAQDELH